MLEFSPTPPAPGSAWESRYHIETRSFNLFYWKAVMSDTELHWNIEDLIPHRGRMLLLDDILRLDTEAAVSSTRVKETWPLVDGIRLLPYSRGTCGPDLRVVQWVGVDPRTGRRFG